MKKFKRLLATVLIASMLLTTNAASVFAEGIGAGTEEQLNEETFETSEETTVGANLGEPEEDTVGGEQSSGLFSACGARPEDEENSTEAKLGESEEDTRRGERLSEPALEDEEESTEANADEELEEEELSEPEEETLELNKKDEVAYGTPVTKFYFIFYANNDDYLQYQTSAIGFDDGDGEDSLNDLFDNFENLDAAHPKGFYKIEAESLENAKENLIRWSEKTVDYDIDAVKSLYRAWVEAGATEDVYYGVLIDSYFCLLYQNEDGAQIMRLENYTTEDDLQVHLNTIKNNPPEGKVFKTWQYWHSCWYEDEGYDFTDDGEKAFYLALAEDEEEYYDDAGLLYMFGRMSTYEDMHFGARYKDAEPANMYWQFDDDTHTIHYYAEAGTGRKPLLIGSSGIVYNGLDKSDVLYAEFDQYIEATYVDELFYGFTNLDSIKNLNNLDTRNVTSMRSMFWECSELSSLTLGSNFVTSQVIDMSGMFAGCYNLSTIDFGSEFDTSNVTNMSSMFFNSKYKVLDLRNFDTSSVTEIGQMFMHCEDLTTIYVSDSFDLSSVSSSAQMFDSCSSLRGERGTNYDSSKIDMEYAHIDGGKENPGYFSSGPARPTLDTSGTPKFYIVAFDEDKTKKIYSVTKAAGVDEFNDILDRLARPDQTCSVDGYSLIDGSAKSNTGYPVFLYEVDLKDNYDEAAGLGPTSLSREDLIGLYQSFADTTEVYDIYVGTCYSPFITEIMDVSGLDLPCFDDPYYFYYFEENTSLNIASASITVKYSNDAIGDIKYTDDMTNFSVEPAVFRLGDKSVAIKYKGLSYTIAVNMYVWQNSDGWSSDVYRIFNVFNYKKIYIEGEKFDPTDLKIDSDYFFASPGRDIVLDYRDDNKSHWVIPDDELVYGQDKVRIQVGGYSGAIYDVPIEVCKRGQSSEIKTNPKTYYYEDDTLNADDLQNLEVTVHYPQGSTPAEETFRYADKPAYFNITPAVGSTLTPNDLKLTINIAGTTVDYPIVVLPPIDPDWIYLEKDPDKTTYYTGEFFDPSGLKIGIKYNNGMIKIVEYCDETNDNFDFKPTLTTGLLYTNESVVILYKNKHSGWVDTILKINVKKPVSRVEYVSGPITKVYSKGDQFDPTGLVVKVVYDDDSDEDITYNSSTATQFTFTPALDHVFTDSDVNKVPQVSIGGATPQDIEGIIIYGDCFSFVGIDSTTDLVAVHPNITDRDAFEVLLDDAIANGAIGFHIITANGINDAKKKYNKYTTKTLDKDGALVEFDNYIPGSDKVFIGASFKAPNPPTPTPPTPTPTPSYDDGRDGGGGSSGGPAISGANQVNIFTINKIPASSMLYDPALYAALMSYPENINMQKTNALDIYGNTGFGRWLRVPNTTTWYFYAGDFSNGAASSGFLKDGWFNLGWDGVDRWYRFDSNGVMQLGWYEENGKIYFLQNDLNDNWYGKAVTGTHVIDGKTYTFDATGALIQ